VKFYESVGKLPIVVDIAVIVIPAKFVLKSLEEIAEK
jgi:acyl-CoA synthetase (NDP forming)